MSLAPTDTTLEFKEIRKEWKQRKKEEDNQRKVEEERARAANGGSEPSADPNQPPGGQNYPPGPGRPQLPPIGYAPASGQVPAGGYPSGVDQMYQAQGNGQVYPQYPHSPYGQGQQMHEVPESLGRQHDADQQRRN